jgi:hypothetical protein
MPIAQRIKENSPIPELIDIEYNFPFALAPIVLPLSP